MSIAEHLNDNAVVNDIRLEIRHPSGRDKVWMVVEGIDDQRLFNKFFDRKHVQIKISHGGVSMVKPIVDILLKETTRILGIRDADFLHLEQNSRTPEPHIFLTDYHDIEMMLLACDKAYQSVYAAYCDNKKEPELLRENILKSIAFIGGLKWLNISGVLGLCFEDLGLAGFFDGEKILLDEEKYLFVVMQRSKKKKREVLKEEVMEKIKDINDFLNLCNGHDFQKALALYINAHSDKAKIKEDAISKAFQVAYRFEDFQESELFKQLKVWADNQGFQLFIT